MALHSLNLFPLKTHATKRNLFLFPSRNPNPNPNPNFFSSISSFPGAKLVTSPPLAAPPFPSHVRCSVTGHGDHDRDRVSHPRPQEIPWSKELANSVRLIGTVGTPVQIKHLTSGKVVAWTRIGVWKSATDTTWINLTFWDDLAQVAFQHVEEGQQVHVVGRLVSDVVEGENDEKQKVYYKVVVQELNFIERNVPQISLYERGANSIASGAKPGEYAGNRGGSMEELWQAFFANPTDWWDNRNNKRNPKAPDFKHKDTGEALWMEGKYNPTWVKSQLEILDTRMSSLQASEARTSFTHDDFSSF